MKHAMRQVGVSLSPTRTAFGPLLFSGELERGLEEVRRLGYPGVELSLRDSEALDREAIAASLRRLGLEVYAIATGQSWVTDGWSLYADEAPRREAAVRRIRGHIEFAARLGCRVIIGGVRGRTDTDGPDSAGRRAAGDAALEECARYARERGVTLLIEPLNRYETNLIHTAAEGLAVIESLGLDNVKLLLDTFHMNIEEASFEEAFRRAGPALGYVHFADSNRRAPGLGHTPFERIVAVLAQVGYAGPIVMEVLPQPDDLQAAEQGLRHVRALLEREQTTAR